jgi:hypothetical protein
MPRMRARVLGLAVFALIAAGCDSSDEGTPAACLEPAGGYLEALEDAPGPVRVAGTTPISDCLRTDQSAGEIESVGQSLIEATTRLNATARRDPGGVSTVRLGYLSGSVHEGVGDDAGVTADLLRRLDSAARFNPGGGSPGASFERAFGKGYAAGQASG